MMVVSFSPGRYASSASKIISVQLPVFGQELFLLGRGLAGTSGGPIRGRTFTV